MRPPPTHITTDGVRWAREKPTEAVKPSTAARQSPLNLSHDVVRREEQDDLAVGAGRTMTAFLGLRLAFF